MTTTYNNAGSTYAEIPIGGPCVGSQNTRSWITVYYIGKVKLQPKLFGASLDRGSKFPSANERVDNRASFIFLGKVVLRPDGHVPFFNL